MTQLTAMNPETQQTIIGVLGLTVVFGVALLEGYNGRVTTAYAVAVVALVAPDQLNRLPWGPDRGR